MTPDAMFVDHLDKLLSTYCSHYTVSGPIYRLRVYCTGVFNFISFGLDCLTLQRRRGELNKKKISLSFFDNNFVWVASLRF